MDVILKTMVQCFLCLQTPADPPSQAGLKVACLRNIWRYLQIDPSEILKENRKQSTVDLSERKDNILAHFCDQSYSVTETLSSLLLELETVKLKVDHYSTVFHRILEEGELVSAAERAKGPCQSTDAPVVNHLREITKQKCADRQKLVTSNHVPVVLLNKLQTETNDGKGGTVPSSVNSSSNFKIERLEEEATWEETESSTSDTYNPDSEQIVLTFPASDDSPPSELQTDSIGPPEPWDSSSIRVNMERIFENISKTSYQVRSSTHYSCSWCSEDVTVARKSGNYHLASRHPEKLLAFAQDPLTPDESFQQLCSSAVEQELKKCRVLRVKKPNGELRFPSMCPHICSTCDTRRCDQRLLRTHLIMQHSDILRDTLYKLQGHSNNLQTTEINQKLNVLNVCLSATSKKQQHGPPKTFLRAGREYATARGGGPTPVNVLIGALQSERTIDMNQVVKNVLARSYRCTVPRKMFQCGVCSAIVTSRTRQGHVFMQHPEKVLFFAQHANVTVAVFKKLCLSALDEEAKQCEVVRKRPTVSVCSSPHICYICRKVICDRQRLKEHLITNHLDILKERLQRLQGVDTEGRSSTGGVESTTSSYQRGAEPPDNFEETITGDVDMEEDDPEAMVGNAEEYEEESGSQAYSADPLCLEESTSLTGEGHCRKVEVEGSDDGDTAQIW